VVMCKVGKSALGAAAAASHTASLAGDDAVYEAVLRRYGVLRAHSVREFFTLAASASIAPRPKNRAIALLTVSGGVGVLMADDAAGAALEVPPLPDAAQQQLRQWVPFAAPRNPVDITGQVTNDATLLERSARLMLQGGQFGSWLGFFAAAGLSESFWPVLHGMVQNLRAENPDTLLALCTLITPERRAALEALGCLVFEDPTEAVRSMGALAAHSDYLVCIDGDAMLDADAVNYLVAPLIANPRVGAVTGNPRIRTRSTLIGKIQVGEFSSIIGLIKRTQRIYGQVFTISGAVAAFHRTALDKVGYWSLDMITEDIDISWKLQRGHWSIFYEPRALCWILMPETLRGLWKQRLRWSQGGAEVFLKYLGKLLRWEYRRLWPMAMEFCLSVSWAFAFAISLLLWGLGHVLPMPSDMHVIGMLPPGFTGLLLCLVCLIQFGVSALIDRRYEPDLPRALWWVIWYPLVYWMLTLFTTLLAFPKVILRKQRSRRARWISPDRGIKPPETA